MKNINMDMHPVVIRDDNVYQGAAFSMHDRDVRLNGDTIIHRQLLVHAPVVVMLIHDVKMDRYLIEREYRTGSNTYAYGVPAGFIDDGETPAQALWRELQEETGVVSDDYTVTYRNETYSSEGMSDEYAYLYGIDLHDHAVVDTHFDRDEYVKSEWLSFDDMMALPIRSSNSVIVIQAEQMRRYKMAHQ